MFLLNLGYRWTVPSDIERLDGTVVLASANNSARLERASSHDATHVLIDPQLYLAELDATTCSKACARLATHPWFGVGDVPEFDSSEMNRREWEGDVQAAVVENWPSSAPTGDAIADACDQCVAFQQRFGCSHIILPTPLIQNREDEGQPQAAWLDGGLQSATDLDVGQPLLATVALAETVLNDASFEAAEFLDTIVDQVTARENLDGVYIVVAKATRTHPLQSDRMVLRAYLHLCNSFRKSGVGTVITNFCDVFGLACMAHGADGFATGPSQALRQLSLDAFLDEQFGRALPHFYSHRIIGELRTEQDLDQIRDARLLRRVRDVTRYSRALMRELSSGGSAASLPDWAEAPNNLRAAQRHFVTRMVEAERQLRELTATERSDEVRGWLEDAVAGSDYVAKRLAPERLRGTLAASNIWLDLFDQALES